MVGTIAEVEQVKTVSVYVNRYHIQNVKELPGVWQVVGMYFKPSHKVKGSLGCLWFPDYWNGNRDKLYTDSDPEWIEFIDGLADTVEKEGVSTVMFYWP